MSEDIITLLKEKLKMMRALMTALRDSRAWWN
jgi:hypothetical protein